MSFTGFFTTSTLLTLLSGTAVMLEVIRVLGLLRSQGWRPLRTLVFASWDAEEYNSIGSTEFVEENIDALREDAIAYLNVDVGVVGDTFRASGSPVLQKALLQVLNRVSDPTKEKTFRQIWAETSTKLGGLGAGGDYVAFQDLAGCSSIDFGFDGPGYPVHSCYETFEWMEKFGDPGFKYHQALAQIWVLLIIELVQEPLLPFDMNVYSAAIADYLDKLERYAHARGSPWDPDKPEESFDLLTLFQAANRLKKNAQTFHSFEEYYYGQVRGGGLFESNALAMARMHYNNRLSDFESNLLDLPTGGDDDRTHGVSTKSHA